MRAYGNPHGFETVFDSNPQVEIGADGNDRKSIITQGVWASMCKRHDGLDVSLSSIIDQGGQIIISPQYLSQNVWEIDNTELIGNQT